MMKNEKDYSDIVDTVWPRPSVRPKMALEQRAKIFLPFSALTGYEKALDETMEKSILSNEFRTGKIQFE